MRYMFIELLPIHRDLYRTEGISKWIVTEIYKEYVFEKEKHPMDFIDFGDIAFCIDYTECGLLSVPPTFFKDIYLGLLKKFGEGWLRPYHIRFRGATVDEKFLYEEWIKAHEEYEKILSECIYAQEPNEVIVTKEEVE